MIFQDFGIHRDTDLALNVVLKLDYQTQSLTLFPDMVYFQKKGGKDESNYLSLLTNGKSRSSFSFTERQLSFNEEKKLTGISSKLSKAFKKTLTW